MTTRVWLTSDWAWTDRTRLCEAWQTDNSCLLAERLPTHDPDAGHGFLNQYPKLFAYHVN